MPILSRKDLERISRRVLFRYLTLSDRKMDRIDPVDFAEKICGLHFAFADMSVTGSILGLTSYSDVDLTISVPRGNGSVQEFHLNGNIAYVDQNLANAGSVGRLNFTLVHEAAHQILGMLYPEEYNPSAQPFICRLADERCTYPITDWVEWQTNVLTAYLLLPRELIDRYMDELGLGRQIKLLNKVFAPKEYALFSEMAKRLGVSKTALSIRLDNLGMIGRNDFIMTTKPLTKSTSCCGSRSCESSEAGQSREEHGEAAVLFSALSVDQAHRAGKEKANEHSQAHRLRHHVCRAGRRCCGAAPADGIVLRDWPSGQRQGRKRRRCRGVGIPASGLSHSRGLFSPQCAPYAGVLRSLRGIP